MIYFAVQNRKYEIQWPAILQRKLGSDNPCLSLAFQRSSQKITTSLNSQHIVRSAESICIKGQFQAPKSAFLKLTPLVLRKIATTVRFLVGHLQVTVFKFHSNWRNQLKPDFCLAIAVLPICQTSPFCLS